MRIQEELILESLYRNDDPLSTTQLKASTGLDADAIGYAVRHKLEPAGLIDYWLQDDHGTQVRIHTLTEKGNSEIQQGLIGDVFGDGSTTEDNPERVALEARIDDLEDDVKKLQNKTQANKQLIDSLRGRVESAVEYIKTHDQRLNGIRWALDSELGIDVAEYVKRVRSD